MMTDDNWEDWLDQRKSACQLDSASTVTLKATFESKLDPIKFARLPDEVKGEQSRGVVSGVDCSSASAASGTSSNVAFSVTT
jgi:hypothetical protein